MKTRMASAAAVALGIVMGCGNDRSRQSGPLDPSVARMRPVSASHADRSERRHVALRDDCDPRDPAWSPTGGCQLEEGDVTMLEFGLLLNSPLSLAVVGHPAWTIDPTYVKVEAPGAVRVTNEGGRAHTFTRVNQFGGGRVPPLNTGLIPAPECASAETLQPGDEAEVKGLAAGIHRFQCCIHPWMRALVRVKADEDEDG